MILLFSGGIDSYIAWHFLGKPDTLYFNLNTAYSDREQIVVKDLIPTTIIETDTIDFSIREEQYTAYVPYRNLHLALLANKYSDTIVIAGLKDDKVNDKNKIVFRKFSTLMSNMTGRNIQVVSPFWDMTKEQVVRWYLQNGGTAIKLLSTFSCYSFEDTNYCGRCAACFRKWCALKANDIHDIGFFDNRIMRDYYESALRKKYVPLRNQNIIKQVLRVHPEWRKS
jgi:7-cyano-7-deazaguanine synthase